MLLWLDESFLNHCQNQYRYDMAEGRVQIGQISQEEEETCYLYTTTLCAHEITAHSLLPSPQQPQNLTQLCKATEAS